MKNLINKIKNLIRFGKITNIDNDSKPIPQAQFQYYDKVKDIIVLYPYGYSANAPLNNLSVIMNVGHEENSVAIPFSEQNRVRNLKQGEVIVSNYLTKSVIKFSENGDIEVDSTNDLKINVNGNTSVTTTGTTNVTSTGDLTVTAPNTTSNTVLTNNGNVTINGALQVNGTITATGAISGLSVFAGGSSMASSGNVTAAGALSGATVSAGGKDLATHVHTGVTSGGSNTGPPA